MKILAENTNNDLFVGPNNQLTVLTGIEAVSQACESAIEAQRGELRYDLNRGVPTSQTLWTGVSNQQRFQFYCVEALRSVPGVQSVQRFNSEILNGVLVYEAVIPTDFGVVSIGGNLFDGV